MLVLCLFVWIFILLLAIIYVILTVVLTMTTQNIVYVYAGLFAVIIVGPLLVFIF